MPDSRKNGIIKSIKDQAIFRNWFEAIYTEYFERLYRYAFSITKSKDLAEDVVEEVFLKIWEKQDGNVEIHDLKTYLFVSVKHVAIRIASKDPQRFAYGNYEQLVQIADSVDPETLLMGSELESLIETAISSLPPHCALVYNLVRQQGKSHEQVATELGMARKTVESHIYKALQRIREHLDKHLPNSGREVKVLFRQITLALLLSGLLSGIILHS